MFSRSGEKGSTFHHLIICANFKNEFVFLLGEKFPIIFFHVAYQDTGVCMHCRPVILVCVCTVGLCHSKVWVRLSFLHIFSSPWVGVAL
jgi:hypothetical protein